MIRACLLTLIKFTRLLQNLKKLQVIDLFYEFEKCENKFKHIFKKILILMLHVKIFLIKRIVKNKKLAKSIYIICDCQKFSIKV